MAGKQAVETIKFSQKMSFEPILSYLKATDRR